MPSADPAADFPSEDATPGERCAAHPGRPAADPCPVCRLPRCAADAASATGCLICEGRTVGPTARPSLGTGPLAGAAALTHVVAIAAAYIGQQYVEVHWFSLLVPAGVGIVCAIAAERGAGRARGVPLRVLAAVYAVVSTALAFRLEASVDVLGPIGTVGPPYLAAAVGAWFWTQPPSAKKTRKPAAAD